MPPTPRPFSLPFVDHHHHPRTHGGSGGGGHAKEPPLHAFLRALASRLAGKASLYLHKALAANRPGRADARVRSRGGDRSAVSDS